MRVHDVLRLTGNMHEGVIVCHSSSAGQMIDLLKCLLALGKDIEGQWLLPRVGNNGLLQFTVSHDL